ncbi:hypothetical protein ACWYXJ_02195 [Janthinobacterium lividum]|uniref:hypothetical protein n=1 Tax=Janthinobacterium lividum TaxID=29581 RepID=UPI0013923B77|nr:hypothetical protein [Janthinobacterium lividum]
MASQANAKGIFLDCISSPVHPENDCLWLAPEDTQNTGVRIQTFAQNQAAKHMFSNNEINRGELSLERMSPYKKCILPVRIRAQDRPASISCHACRSFARAAPPRASGLSL